VKTPKHAEKTVLQDCCGWPIEEKNEDMLKERYTGCPRRNVKYFGRVFLMLNYTDITQNTYIQS